MKLIVGLGNPGLHYSKTRHNIGRRLIEILAARYKARWNSNRSLATRWAEVDEESVSCILALPETFMNESGEAIRRLIEHYKIDVKSDLLAVVDDVALPFGRLRLRGSGQDGGHRGLRSIEKTLGSQDYARLRIGIAPSGPIKQTLEKYVLSRFNRDEEKKLGEIFERGVESCLLWLTVPIERAMDRTNQPSLL